MSTETEPLNSYKFYEFTAKHQTEVIILNMYFVQKELDVSVLKRNRKHEKAFKNSL